MTLTNFYITGINYKNKECYITLQEILDSETKLKIKEKVKNSLVGTPFLKYFPPLPDELGSNTYFIPVTPEAFYEKKLEVGMTVKLDIPSSILDIHKINTTGQKVKLE